MTDHDASKTDPVMGPFTAERCPDDDDYFPNLDWRLFIGKKCTVDSHVATVYENGGFAFARARLFCAAPDLLRAAKELVRIWEISGWDDTEGCDCPRCALRAAIAKAEETK